MSSPNIFVSRKGHQVDGGEVSVNGYQVKTEEHSQNLDNEPHQGQTGLNAQNLWRKPENKNREAKLGRGKKITNHDKKTEQ